MKKIIMMISVLLIGGHLFAQGIRFENPESWQSLVALAKSKNKPIFIDCYATWCQPCKQLERNIFSRTDVGSFYNDNFISVRLQFDKTQKDSELTQKQRSIVEKIEKAMTVNAFPTLLFFDADGNPILKEVGGATDPEKIISYAKRALHPEEEYYGLMRRYEQGEKDAAMVKKLLPQAVKYQNYEIANQLHDQYVDLLKNPWDKYELSMVYSSMRNSDAKGFTLLRDHQAEIDSLLGEKGKVESVLKMHLTYEVYNRFIKDKKSIAWKDIKNYLMQKVPTLSERIILERKIDLAADNKKWEEHYRLKMDHYDRYLKSTSHNEAFIMNNELMDVFRNVKDKITLMRAADWAKWALENLYDRNDGTVLDTYANLLYKAGKTSEAIIWQKKAVACIGNATEEDQAEVKGNLEKMLKGLPTWKEN